MFEYEHSSKFNLSPESREALVNEIEGDDFHLSPLQGKVMLNDIEDILDNSTGKSLKEIENEFIKVTGIISEDIIHEMFKEVSDFISIEPQIPSVKKNYLHTSQLNITTENTRGEIIELISSQKEHSEMALLSLYVYREMDKIDWLPFLKAAVERNPVCNTELNGKNNSDVYKILKEMPDESIYDGNRLALPDEVWNFRRGDGLEKALLLADFIHKNDNASGITIRVDAKKVVLNAHGDDFHFSSSKGFRKKIQIQGASYKIE
jgi:hypothetical protein